MNKDRRTILALGAGSAVALGTSTILGLKFVRSRGPERAALPPPWIVAGLDMARRSGLPAILVIVPADDAQMIRVSDALTERLKSPALVDLFAGAVWMCIREGDAEGIFPGGRRIHRLSPQGAVETSSDAPFPAFESDKAFDQVVSPLIERDFAERLVVAWSRVTDQETLRSELKTLDGLALVRRLPDIAPILIAELRRQNDPDVRIALRELLVRSFLIPQKVSRGSTCHLPYGAVMAYHNACGGDPRLPPPEEQVMMACGMGMMSDPRIIKFLAVR